MIGPPKVINRELNGKKLEPFEVHKSPSRPKWRYEFIFCIHGSSIEDPLFHP